MPFSYSNCAHSATLTYDILQYEVPADDEGDELADAHVAVHVRRARLRDARAELRVAQTWGCGARVMRRRCLLGRSGGLGFKDVKGLCRKEDGFIARVMRNVRAMKIRLLRQGRDSNPLLYLFINATCICAS